MYNWIPVLYTWNQHNTVNQLYINKNKLLSKKWEAIILQSTIIGYFSWFKAFYINIRTMKSTELHDEIISSNKNRNVNAGDIRDMGSIPGSGRFPGGGHSNPLQYSCLWRIPWTEEPGGLRSMGSQRVGHDWSNSACACTHTHTHTHTHTTNNNGKVYIMQS